MPANGGPLAVRPLLGGCAPAYWWDQGHKDVDGRACGNTPVIAVLGYDWVVAAVLADTGHNG